MDVLEVGEVARLVASFSGPPYPADVTLDITAPDGTVTHLLEAALTNDPVGSGEWYYELPVAQAGVYEYRYFGSGGTTAAGTGFVLVSAAGVAPLHGPCTPWCTNQDVLNCRADLADQMDAVRRGVVLASEILYFSTKQRFPGLCRYEFSVCRDCVSCWNRGRCTCAPRQRVDLSANNVKAVLRVTIEGVDLARTAYRLDENRWLVRLDDDIWPACSDLTDPENFQIEIVAGDEPPEGGRQMAARLAGELAGRCAGLACALPARITGVTSEGNIYTLVDPTTIIERGATGLDDVDLWVHNINLPPPSGMFDPAGKRDRLIRTGS